MTSPGLGSSRFVIQMEPWTSFQGPLILTQRVISGALGIWGNYGQLQAIFAGIDTMFVMNADRVRTSDISDRRNLQMLLGHIVQVPNLEKAEDGAMLRHATWGTVASSQKYLIYSNLIFIFEDLLSRKMKMDPDIASHFLEPSAPAKLRQQSCISRFSSHALRDWGC